MTGETTHVVPPPALPLPRLLAIADAGRATLGQAVQIAADPVAGRVYALSGRQIIAPVVSSPWADHLVAADRDTGAVVWQFGTLSSAFPDTQHRLSGIVVDRDAHRVVLATSTQVLALDATSGARVAQATLPVGVDCVNFPAPTRPPTLDAHSRALFACRGSTPQGAIVGVLADLATGAVTLVAPPPDGDQPAPPGPGILGHSYVLTDSGLYVLAQGATAGATPIAALPFNVGGLARSLVVETAADGSPTGRLYLAGIGGQVAIVRDDTPEALSGQTGTLWATILAERAVALTIAPERFQQSGTLPTLPGFLVAPGRLAHTACFGETQPLTPGSVTTSTQATLAADGSVRVELGLSVRGEQGQETGSRHWIVSVAPNGASSILSDEGSVDPFQPLPPQPCPV